MDLASILIIGALVLIVPLALFMGFVGLALLIWSWKRIGPYFVSFGRWVADWRNIIPLGCLGIVAIIVIVLLAAVLPPELSILRTAILALVILVGVLFTIVALGVWTIRLIAWVWPHFRRGFWDYLQKGWDFVWKGGAVRQRARKPPQGEPKALPKGAPAQQPPSQAGGAPTTDARPIARSAPRPRRSRLDVTWLWALLSGKPRKPVKKVKPADRAAEPKPQVSAKPKERKMVRVPTKPRVGLRPIIWRLGLIIPWLQGKLQRSGQKAKPMPVTLHKAPGVPDRPGTPAGGGPGQPGEGAPAPAAKAAEAKPKAVLTAGTKRKRSLAESLERTAGAMLNAVQSIRKRFWLGIFWILGKARAGVDYVSRVPRRFKK